MLFRLRALLPASLVLLAACSAGTPGPDGIRDPYESVNRQVHAFNKGFDRAVFRPASQAYGFVLPAYARDRVDNFSQFLNLPTHIINDALQGRGADAFHNGFRFLTNLTVGVFGLFDPASSFGLTPRSTDFGETLDTWGAGEGAYLEVPFFGPYTQRDLAGDVVDLVLNPLTIVTLSPPEAFIPPSAYILENTNYRYEFTDTVDQILYESADSYAQARLIFLENRRFELGNRSGETAAPIDPYEELFPDG